jgi:hypothetical protein
MDSWHFSAEFESLLCSADFSSLSSESDDPDWDVDVEQEEANDPSHKDTDWNGNQTLGGNV